MVDVLETTDEIPELGEGEEDIADDVVKTTDADDVMELELEITELEVIPELDLELVLEVCGQSAPVQYVRDAKI